MESKQYIGGFDGAANPNPGVISIGGWIGTPFRQIIFRFSEIAGYGSGNEAEYHALIRLLKEVRNLEIQNISIRGDSEAVINHMNRVAKVKSKSMRVLFNQARNLIRGINVTFSHVPRTNNKMADELSKAAYKRSNQKCRKLNF
jgi:ribonuclease HI